MSSSLLDQAEVIRTHGGGDRKLPASALRWLFQLRSKWPERPLELDGFLSPLEWIDAASVDIDHGKVLIKNDLHALWLAIDMIDDTHADPDGDYFWLLLDADRSRRVTPYRDLLIATPNGQPDRLMMWKVIDEYGACVDGIDMVRSKFRRSFGPTMHSRVPHRYWELRLDFDEIDASLPAHGANIIRFGVRVASRTPGLATDSPERLDYSRFHEVVLATPSIDYGKGAGLMIGGIGYIGADCIDPQTALATSTRIPVAVRNAAFGGTLNFNGNVETLRRMKTAGLRRFSIAHSFAPTIDILDQVPATPLRIGWTNYRAVGSGYEAQGFAADAEATYPLPDPDQEYLLKGLLFQWATGAEPNGFHRLVLTSYDDEKRPNADFEHSLTLKIDNHHPEASVIALKRPGGEVVRECELVRLANASEAMEIAFRAYDGEGMLDGYRIEAGYGNNRRMPIAEVSYDPGTMGPAWNGEIEQTVAFRPPQTCAYGIHVTAWGRVTDGYSPRIQRADHSAFVAIEVL